MSAFEEDEVNKMGLDDRIPHQRLRLLFKFFTIDPSAWAALRMGTRGVRTRSTTPPRCRSRRPRRPRVSHRRTYPNMTNPHSL